MFQNIFVLFLIKDKDCDNTMNGKMEGGVLEVSQFIPSVHKSTKHLDIGFANAALKVWNELPGEIRSATSLS